MKKKNLLLALLLFLLFIQSNVPSLAAGMIPPQRTIDSFHRGSGLIQQNKPRGPNSSVPLNRFSHSIVTSSALPTVWNPINPSSLNYQKVIGVRNQDELGICWAYSGVDAMMQAAYSSSPITTQIYSPNYYNYLSAENAFTSGVNPLAIPRDLDGGGTIDYVGTMAMLGYPPVLESTFPTPELNNQNTPIVQTTFNAFPKTNVTTNAVYTLYGLTPSASMGTTLQTQIQDRLTTMKQMIQTYGSIQFGIDANTCIGNGVPSPYTNNKNGFNSYVPYSAAASLSQGGYLSVDHAILIVGWDDNYAKTNFKNMPKDNGAFLVQNSWGTSWGTSGYYYVSYDDLYVASSDLVVLDTIYRSANEKVYSYVNTVEAAYIDFSQASGQGLNNNALAANVFTSQNLGSGVAEHLNAIGFYTNQQNVMINVLYAPTAIVASSTQPQFTVLASNILLQNAGFQKISLSSLRLPNNTSFTIAVQITNAQNFTDFILPCQSVEANTGNANTQEYPILAQGRSYISNTPSNTAYNWENISQDYGTNLYITAYTTTAADTPFTQKYVNGAYYLYDNSGYMLTGFQQVPSGNTTITCYYNAQGQMLFGQQTISGHKYLFSTSTGAMLTGFQKVGGQTYYYNTLGQMLTGQQTINGHKYLFNTSTGAMLTGFQKISGKTYYYNTSGQMLIGQQTISGHKYLFNTSTGVMLMGFQKISGKTYYYNASGQMLFGRQKINGHNYLFNKTTGAMLTGFQSLKAYGLNETAYYNSSGQMLFGQQIIGGKHYLFNKSNGARMTGFQNLKAYGANKIVYYNSSGQMLFGQQKIGKYYYLLNSSTGARMTGFQKIKSGKTTKTYYYNASGQKLFGLHIINKRVYYFNRKTGALE